MKRVAFMGVGALGSNAAVLCRSLHATVFRFVDFDRVEAKNLQAQAYVRQNVGQNKAQALHDLFYNHWGLKHEVAGVRAAHNNVAALCKNCDLVVDCFDNYESRHLLQKYCIGYKVPLVHAGIAATGDFGLVRWTEHFTPDKEDGAGAATCESGEHLPFIGVMAASLACVIQQFIQKDQRRDATVLPGGATFY